MDDAKRARIYYRRHLALCSFRKIIVRCAQRGCIPRVETAIRDQIPIAALLTAFGAYATVTDNPHRLNRQRAKLLTLKKQLARATHRPFDAELFRAQSTSFLRRFYDSDVS